MMPMVPAYIELPNIFRPLQNHPLEHSHLKEHFAWGMLPARGIPLKTATLGEQSTWLLRETL